MGQELGFSLDRATREAIPSVRERLPLVAPERIRDELTRLLVTARPSVPLRWMRRQGLLGAVLPELMEGHRKRQRRGPRGVSVLEHALRTLDHLPPAPRLRWAGLLHDVGKPRCRRGLGESVAFLGHEALSADLAKEILGRLRFSGGAVRGIVHLIRHHDVPDRGTLSDAQLRRFLLQVGPQWIEELLALRRADRLASGIDPPPVDGLAALQRRVGRILTETQGLETLRPVLGGDAVKAVVGLEAGPTVGRLLAGLQELIVEDPSVNTRERLMAWLEAQRR
jgi:putative nucleotidyltransferase with HDIG domain